MGLDRKKVLFIAHHFPPLGGPGVNRAMQFAKHLSEEGYELHVLTVAIQDIEEGAYPPDYTLLDKLPKDLKIHRVSIAQPKGLRNFFIKLKLFRVLWYLLYPLFWEPSARWPRRCLKDALEIIDREGIRLVWSSAGPFAAAQLGAMIRKRRPQVRWVCDLRDPFTDTYTFQWPSKLHWYLCRWMEARIFGRADKVVVVTPGMKRLYLKRGIVKPEKITVITNGYGDA